MDYLASIRKKEREKFWHILKETKKEPCESVQDEKNELNELSLDGGDGIESCPPSPRVACVRDVAMEPAAMNATPIFWERMSTGAILGPAQPEFLAKVSSGLLASYWVVVTYQSEPVWINADSLRSKRQFESQWRPIRPTAHSIPQIPTVKPKLIRVEQSSLEFSDGRERTQTEAEGRRL